MANDTRQTAQNLGALGPTPTRQTDRIGFKGTNNVLEKEDFYKFTLAEESDVNLVLDRLDADAGVQILDSTGTELFTSDNTGFLAEVIDADLEAGEYFARVFRKGRNQTNYQLSLSSAPIGLAEDDKAPGIRLGDDVLNKIGEGITVSDEVGFTDRGQRDKADFYNFTIDERSDFNLTLDQLTGTGNVDVELLADDGRTILFQSRNEEKEPEAINAILDPGKYVIQVKPKTSARAEYRLEIDADSDIEGEKADDKFPGIDLGTLLGEPDQKEQSIYTFSEIGYGKRKGRDTKDHFTFTLDKDALFYADMDRLKGNANLQIFEYNRNRRGPLLFDRKEKGRKPERINEGDVLEAGTYAVRVNAQGGAKTDYRLGLTAIDADLDDAPTWERAKDLGEISDDTQIREAGEVGANIVTNFRDQADWFKFSVSGEKNVELSLEGLARNADVELYESDGETLVDSSTKRGDAPENINQTLEAGTYLIKVLPQGANSTSYTLDLSAEEPIEPRQWLDLADLTGKEYSQFEEIGGEGSGVRNTLDVYSFKLTQSVDFSATLDQNQENADLELWKSGRKLDFEEDALDDDREEVSSREPGRGSELIEKVLAPGDYNLRVVPVGAADTEYRIGIDATNIIEDEGVQTFDDVEAPLTRYTNRDSVGFVNGGVPNSKDVYNFSLDSESSFQLTLNELSGNANVMVLDSEGERVLSNFKSGRVPENLKGTLAAGDYSVEVFPVGRAKARYFLSMNATDIGGGEDDDIPETAPSFNPAGEILRDDVGKKGDDGGRDLQDYRKITLTERSELTLNLDNLKKNADLQLLGSDGTTVLAESTNGGKDSEAISEVLDAGDYYALVEVKSSGSTPYKLSGSVVPAGGGEDPNGTPATADALGTFGVDELTNPDKKIGFRENGAVDANDYYRFTLVADDSVVVFLDGISQDVNLDLLNSSGGVIESSNGSGVDSEMISTSLSAGDYLVRVYPGSSGALSSYNLNIF